MFVFVEFTDTYGGEANYCWVDRYKVSARDLKHAITKAKQARYHGMNPFTNRPLPRHTLSDFGDMLRIDMNGSPVCAFVTEWEDDFHLDYTNVKEI